MGYKTTRFWSSSYKSVSGVCGFIVEISIYDDPFYGISKL